MEKLELQITQLPHAEGLPLPAYGTEDSVGADLNAAIEEPITLQPGERTLIPTGIKVALEPGYEAQLRPRSGLSYKHGLTVLNTPATIDPDYRGEIKVILINLGQEPFTVERGMRIAQMVIAPFTQVTWAQVEELSENTNRRGNGFGSTGIYAQK